jgi:Cys-tRNA(Pro)/Cys-tRNA(Cys) deacylase
MKTNNITRLLEARKIPFKAYELPEEKLGALETSRLLNVPPEQVFKTIVIKREGKGKPILAVVPAGSEVDLKALAKAVGEKKLLLASAREAEALTGLLTGGISPLALINKGFQVIVDQSASTFDSVHISGGQRGLNIHLPVSDLLKLVNARLAEISAQLNP